MTCVNRPCASEDGTQAVLGARVAAQSRDGNRLPWVTPTFYTLSIESVTLIVMHP